LKPAQANSSQVSISKKPIEREGWWSGLSSNPNTANKKKKKRRKK
jgi:hypothetical protein